MPVTLLSSDEGPHPGWHDYTFVRAGKRWRLRTVEAPGADADDSRSYLSVLREDGTAKPTAHVFPQVITLQTAYEVLSMIDREVEHARDIARSTLQREIKGLLGLHG